jgi:hypothetical protein
MKNWKWYVWIAKFLLLAVALIAFVMKELGVDVPWEAVITPAATWLAQMLLGLVPGEGWAKVIGKVLVWAVAAVELIIAQLGVAFPLWAVVAPMIMALAQYLIALVPKET